MARILITAIGSFSADIVIRTLKMKGHDVTGCDVYPKAWLADGESVDRFRQAPRAIDRAAYEAFIEKVCTEERIDFVMPLTDPEVDLLSPLKARYAERGVVICVSGESAVRLCRNKYRLSQFLLKEGFRNAIPTDLLSDVKDPMFPMVIKPAQGRSSQGLERVRDIKKFNYLKETLNVGEFVCQPLIRGSIVTVDVLRDARSSKTVCVARKELLRNPKGAGTTVEIIENSELEEVSALIADKAGIEGAVNFEFIEAEDGLYYLLEINPRFSAGLAFTHLAGYDMVTNNLNCFMGLQIEEKSRIEKMVIARKYQEYVTMHL